VNLLPNKGMDPLRTQRTMGDICRTIDQDHSDDIDLLKLSSRLRKQLFRQAFILLDEDFSGLLEPDEINTFGMFMLGEEWTDDLLTKFMVVADLDHSGGLSFEEFAFFCEDQLLKSVRSDDNAYVSHMVKSFLAYNRQLQERTVAKWQGRALLVDSWCQRLVPPAFFILLFAICAADFEQNA